MELLELICKNYRKQFPWIEDNDHRKIPCVLKLYSREIGAGFSDHWILFFDWNDRSCTYEANDDNGFLIPTWHRGFPDQKYNWTMRKRFEILCSPKEVNTKAKSIPMNGDTYVLTNTNCHNWAIQLAAKFGIQIDSPIENYLPNNLTNVINTGYMVSRLVGDSNISNLVSSFISERSDERDWRSSHSTSNSRVASASGPSFNTGLTLAAVTGAAFGAIALTALLSSNSSGDSPSTRSRSRNNN